LALKKRTGMRMKRRTKRRKRLKKRKKKIKRKKKRRKRKKKRRKKRRKRRKRKKRPKKKNVKRRKKKKERRKRKRRLKKKRIKRKSEKIKNRRKENVNTGKKKKHDDKADDGKEDGKKHRHRHHHRKQRDRRPSKSNVPVPNTPADMLRQALVGSLNKNDGGPPLPPEAEGIPDLPEPVASTGKSFPAEAVPLPQGEDEWDEDEEKSEPKKRVPPGSTSLWKFYSRGRS